MTVEIRRLEKGDSVNDFNCGDEPLNTYLRRYAWKNQIKHQIGVTYVAVQQERRQEVVGYYTLAASNLPRESLPPASAASLPKYSSIPVFLLARLAVDRQFQSQSIGEALLGHALKNCLFLSAQVGSRFVIVDAYPTAIAWYARFGFISLPNSFFSGTQPMVIDLRTVAISLL